MQSVYRGGQEAAQACCKKHAGPAIGGPDRGEWDTSMTPSPAQAALTETLLSLKASEESILGRAEEIQRNILTRSSHVRQPNFTAIHTRDLEFLFDAYDSAFLYGRCRAALDGRKLTFASRRA